MFDKISRFTHNTVFISFFIPVASPAAAAYLAASVAPTVFTSVHDNGMTHHYSPPSDVLDDLKKWLDTSSDAMIATAILKQENSVMGLHVINPADRLKYQVCNSKALPDGEGTTASFFGSASNNPVHDKPTLLDLKAVANVYACVKQSDLPEDSQLPKGKEFDKTSCPLLSQFLPDDKKYHLVRLRVSWPVYAGLTPVQGKLSEETYQLLDEYSPDGAVWARSIVRFNQTLHDHIIDSTTTGTASAFWSSASTRPSRQSSSVSSNCGGARSSRYRRCPCSTGASPSTLSTTALGLPA